MSMFNRILVPLDGSPQAEQAIPHAEYFARIFGASIFLLQVLEPVPNHENPQVVDPLSWQLRKAEVEKYLQNAALRIRENLGEKSTSDEDNGRVVYVIREGKTAENIVDFAHSENIDLLMISTHGSNGLSRWNISSITQKVLNLIYLPVLIVRAYHRSNPEEEFRRYRRILLPIDCSRRAECSLAAGIELARDKQPEEDVDGNILEGSKLVLAAVIRPPELPIPEPYPVEISQLSEQFLQASHLAVDHYIGEMKERLPVECETKVVESSSITSAIHELADQPDIDLVILCAHGFAGQATWPYGTVTHHIIEHGTKSVLVIQDVPRSHVQPTIAELASEKSGRR